MSKLNEIIYNDTPYEIGTTVDSGLSASSENPVQNKVINTALGSIHLGTDPITGLLYVYVNGKRQGTGIDIGAEGIDTSSLEDWFVTPVLQALQYVDELGSDQWVHYVVMADTHYNDTYESLKEQYPSTPDSGIYNMMYNWNHSGAIAKLLMSTGYFDKYIHLGDITDKGDSSQLTLAIDQVGDLNGQMLYCVGNHEASGLNEIGADLYDAFMSELTDGITYYSGFDTTTYMNPFYVYKDDEHKIYFIHFPMYFVNASNANVIDWLWDSINAVPSGYTVILMGHDRSFGGSLKVAHVKMALSLLPSDKRTMPALVGHGHADTLHEYVGWSSLMFVWDAKGLNTDAGLGTENEQAVSILSIGTGTNNVIKEYRIGKHANTYDETFPIIRNINSWYNDPDDVLHVSIDTSGLFYDNEGNNYIRKKWFPVNPSTYYYLYNPEDALTSTATVNKAEYSDTRADAFVGGRISVSVPNGIHDLNCYKMYTTNTSAYMLIGSYSGETHTKKLVLTDQVPIIDVGIDDVNWVHGSIDNFGIPSYSDSASNWLSDKPILVDSSSTYVLANPNSTTSWIAVSRCKGPCAITAVNRTRDAINRVTGSSTPFTFTTTAETRYVFIGFGGSVTEGWTLTKVVA